MLTSDISTAIKSAVKDLGNDILKSPTIVSILSDYHAFNVHDPLLAEKKSAITILAASKYMDRILNWQKQSNSLWQVEDTQWIEQLCKKQGLKRNVVGMMADAMKEAIGLEVSFTEFSDPKKLLTSEIRKYEAALKKLVTTYTDQLGIYGAFFSTSANTELYRFEGRIRILAQAANSHTYDDKWMATARKKVIDSLSLNSLQRTKILNDTISSGLGEYNQIIEQQKKDGKNGAEMFKKGIIDRMKEIAEKVNYAYRQFPHPSRLDADKDVKVAKDEVAKYLRLQKAQEEVERYKLEYQQLLKDTLVVETDCLGLNTAHFNFDRQKEIIELEHKISSYAKELSLPFNADDWFNTEKNLLIAQNATSDDKNHCVARKVLMEDGVKYTELFKEQTVLGKKGKAAFEDTSELTSLAERLNCAFEIIEDKQRIDVVKDVSTAKSDIKAYRRKRFLIISAIIAVILAIMAIIAIDRINYSKHRVEIESFNSTIANGDKALAEGNSVDALNYYRSAQEEYTADYKLDHYKSIATEKMDEASNKIFEEYSSEIKGLLSKGDCKVAKQKYELLVSLHITTDLTSYSSEFEKSLRDAVEERRDKVLKSISDNNGKPSAEDIAEIDNLLYCAPEDYYLNLIKSKMK